MIAKRFGLASIETFFVHIAKYSVLCSKSRPECILFGYLRKLLCSDKKVCHAMVADTNHATATNWWSFYLRVSFLGIYLMMLEKIILTVIRVSTTQWPF